MPVAEIGTLYGRRLDSHFGEFKGVSILIGNDNVSQAPGLYLGRLSEDGPGRHEPGIERIKIRQNNMHVARSSRRGSHTKMKLGVVAPKHGERYGRSIRESYREAENVTIICERLLHIMDVDAWGCLAKRHHGALVPLNGQMPRYHNKTETGSYKNMSKTKQRCAWGLVGGWKCEGP